MKDIETKQEYLDYVDKKSPNSPILKNCFNAFWVGGLICSIGQIIFDFCKYKGFEDTACSTIVSITLIGLAALLTGLNIFNKIGKFAGAGSLVPITGFANSIVSPAIEYKSEGYVMGVGGKMFTVARTSTCIWHFYFCYCRNYSNIFRLKHFIDFFKSKHLLSDYSLNEFYLHNYMYLKFKVSNI